MKIFRNTEGIVTQVRRVAAAIGYPAIETVVM